MSPVNATSLHNLSPRRRIGSTRISVVLALVPFLACMTGSASLVRSFPAPRENRQDMELLQGEWEQVTLEMPDGQIKERKPGDVTWNIKGDTLECTVRDPQTIDGPSRKVCRFSLNASRSVKELDIQEVAHLGDAPGLWIYDIHRDELRVCIGHQNGVGPTADGSVVSVRPRGFETRPGQYIGYFKRVRH